MLDDEFVYVNIVCFIAGCFLPECEMYAPSAHFRKGALRPHSSSSSSSSLLLFLMQFLPSGELLVYCRCCPFFDYIHTAEMHVLSFLWFEENTLGPFYLLFYLFPFPVHHFVSIMSLLHTLLLSLHTYAR